MLDLFYSNGNVFVYDVNTWSELRQKHRIIGELIGNTTFVPTLPLKLHPEEISLLLTKKLVRIVEFSSKLSQDSQILFENSLLDNEIVEYKRIRMEQLQQIKEKIVEKRRKDGDSRSEQQILDDELQKLVVNKENMIWPILLQPHNIQECDKRIVHYENRSKFRDDVFKDLWEKGYFVTSGTKFGGDFLVYQGDPIVFHAIFIIRCVEDEQKIATSEIIAFGRLGTSVKKRAVLASRSQNDERISYITINWIDA